MDTIRQDEYARLLGEKIAEIISLRRENARLRIENDLLKADAVAAHEALQQAEKLTEEIRLMLKV